MQAQPATKPPGVPLRLERRPDQERLRLEGGERDAGRVPAARVDEEPGLPDRAELRVELVERLDLEPPRQEHAQVPPRLQHRARADLLAALESGPEHREVQRQALDAEPRRG